MNTCQIMIIELNIALLSINFVIFDHDRLLIQVIIMTTSPYFVDGINHIFDSHERVVIIIWQDINKLNALFSTATLNSIFIDLLASHCVITLNLVIMKCASQNILKLFSADVTLRKFDVREAIIFELLIGFQSFMG